MHGYGARVKGDVNRTEEAGEDVRRERRRKVSGVRRAGVGCGGCAEGKDRYSWVSPTVYSSGMINHASSLTPSRLTVWQRAAAPSTGPWGTP